MRPRAAAVGRFVVSAAVVAAMLSSPVLPAAAYPMKQCTKDNVGERYKDNIGLIWVCKQEAGRGGYYWEKQPWGTVAITYSGPYLQTLLSFGVSTDSTGRLQAGSMAHARDALGQAWSGADSVVSRTLVQRWNGSAWTTCRDTGLVYSPPGHPTQYASFNWSSPPCGAGYYRDYGSAFMIIDDRWWGGSATSPYVYAVSPAAAEAGDPVPPAPDE